MVLPLVDIKFQLATIGSTDAKPNTSQKVTAPRAVGPSDRTSPPVIKQIFRCVRTAYFDPYFGGWFAAKSNPTGYRSSVAHDVATDTWITVGPNGTDISTDDGRNWRALRPNPTLPEPADKVSEDQHWNALSLPFVVGPHGRIGKLRPAALTSQATGAKP